MDKGVGVGALQIHAKTWEYESLCLCLSGGEQYVGLKQKKGVEGGMLGDDI